MAVDAATDENEPPSPGKGLASRLKGKGLELPGEMPRPLVVSAAAPLKSKAGKHAQAGAIAVGQAHAPAPLAMSESQRRLFTPLRQQGSQAVRAEMQRKVAEEQDLLEGVRATLRKWIQECFARGDKGYKLLEKGVLKCRVQAKWSQAVNDAVQKYISGYGGTAAAESDPQEHSQFLPRTERWVVTFNAAAFEAYAGAHPEAIEPDLAAVERFVQEFAKRPAKERQRQEVLKAALEAEFGTLRPQSIQRAERLLKQQDGKERSAKRKQPGAGSTSLGSKEDASWIAAVLAPFGLLPDGGVVIRPPAAMALRLLIDLQQLDEMASSPGELRDLLRTTDLGRIANALRRHTNTEVAAAAKALVMKWKKSCASGAGGDAAVSDSRTNDGNRSPKRARTSAA